MKQGTQRKQNGGGGLLEKLGANGGPLTGRLDQLAIEARTRLDRIEEHLSRIAGETERLGDRDEVISRRTTGNADGANPLQLGPLAPSAGGIWEVLAIGVTADTAANRTATVGLGAQPAELVVCVITTNSGAGGGGGLLTTGLVLPPGLGLSATFPAATPANTRCVLHVVARELTPEGE